jgi:hypothetical protein
MKKIISVLLSVLFVFSSSALVSAYDPIVLDQDLDDDDVLSSEEKIQRKFLDYYTHKEHGRKPTETEAFIFSKWEPLLKLLDNPVDNPNSYRYGIVKFTSPDPIQKPYYNRFGDSDQCFEYSDVTNRQYPSGIAVFYGDAYIDINYHTFMSLSDVSEQEPVAFEYMAKNIDNYYTTYSPYSHHDGLVEVDNRYFGYVGDADGDCTVSISDVTEIQKHLVGLTTLEKTRLKAAEIDNQEISIDTATQIQLYLAGFTDKIEAPHTEEILVN